MSGKTIEKKWHDQAVRARREAETLPQGVERDRKIKMAEQLDTASEIQAWLSSPGLRPPTGE